MHNALKFLAVAVLLSLMIDSQVLAQPQVLKKVEQSFKKEESKRRREEQQLLTAKWLTPDTNFAALFVEREGPKAILDWLGDPPTGFTTGLNVITKKDEYVGVWQTYSSPTRTVVKLNVLVPHPKYRSLEQMGLLPEFANIKPPFLKVQSSKTVTIKAREATQFEHSSGGCSLLITLKDGAVVRAATPLCRNALELNQLLEGLDIERLSTKLES